MTWSIFRSRRANSRGDRVSINRTPITIGTAMKTNTPSTFYCCLPIEFIDPWEQNDAIRAVREHNLGNSVILQNTCHVGNSDEEREQWKKRYPHAAEQINRVPRFPALQEHGMAALIDMTVDFRIEQIELCRQLGITMINFFPGRLMLPKDEFERFTRAAEGVVLCENIMGENLSILGATLSLERLKQIDATQVVEGSAVQHAKPAAADRPSIFDEPDKLDFAVVQAWFLDRFRAVARQVRESWAGALSAIEASTQMRMAMLVGVEVPILELVPHDPMPGIAGVRGAARACGKTLWGAHAALGYYRPPADQWFPKRLSIAADLFFAAGASIFTECNMPLRVTGSCAAFFSVAASPPKRLGEEERLDFDHPICAEARNVMADYHRFTQFHHRPAAHPRVRMGYVTGHLDNSKERMWFVDHPGFLATDAAKTWKHLDRAFDAEPWYIPPRKYYWQADPARPLRYGTPPCGQIDIVPIEAPPDVLQTYGCLAMLGWNTMTDAHYQNLLAFVRAGGILFLAIPHLSTQTRTDQPQRFIHDGDVRDLCGVHIIGEGETIEEVLFTQPSTDARCVFPVGSLYLESAALAQVELHGARPLAVSRDNAHPDLPVLLEHRVGKGVVYLLNTWTYPGDRLDAFITDILRTLADSQQGDIAVRSRDVFYSVYDGVFPSGAPYRTVYLINHDIYGQPVHPSLIVDQSHETSLRVDGYAMRIAWVIHDLIFSPGDRFVQVADARQEGNTWIVTLESLEAGGERSIQLDTTTGRIASATLNGKTLAVDSDGIVRCHLTARDELRITK